MAAATDPVSNSHPNQPPSVSVKTFHISGILTDVYGLEELSPGYKSISCLWLLHPRLGTKARMASIADSCIGEWNKRPAGDRRVGLIAVAFDQRNHGTREVNALSNESWKEGNPHHAQDMFSVLHGTAQDTSLLIDHLGSYVFNGPGDASIDQHLVLGVSLGGYSAWQILFGDSRVTAGIVIIGCPDYINMMTDRARLTKLATYTNGNGSSFLGSKDFPNALIKAAKLHDPKAMIFGTNAIPASTPDSLIPYQGASSPAIRQLLNSKIAGKRILVCSGGADKLVPYRTSEPFLRFLKEATGKGGWWEEGGVYFENNVYPDIGHAFSEDMVKDTVRFICDTLVQRPSPKTRPLMSYPPLNAPTPFNYLAPVKARY